MFLLYRETPNSFANNHAFFAGIGVVVLSFPTANGCLFCPVSRVMWLTGAVTASRLSSPVVLFCASISLMSGVTLRGYVSDQQEVSVDACMLCHDHTMNYVTVVCPECKGNSSFAESANYVT